MSGFHITLLLIQWLIQHHSDCIKMDTMCISQSLEVWQWVMWKMDVHMRMHVSGTGHTQIWLHTIWRLRCSTSMARLDRRSIYMVWLLVTRCYLLPWVWTMIGFPNIPTRLLWSSHAFTQTLVFGISLRENFLMGWKLWMSTNLEDQPGIFQLKRLLWAGAEFHYGVSWFKALEVMEWKMSQLSGLTIQNKMHKCR